jgi:hypothetical protein
MNPLFASHALARCFGRITIAAGLAACSALGTAAGPGPAAAASAPAAHGTTHTAPPSRPVAPRRLVDINNASKKQLKTLPGVTDAMAERIVAGRPYLTKAHLVTSQAVPAGIYLSIKRSIIAGPPPAVRKS